MELGPKPFKSIALSAYIVVVILVLTSVDGQISIPCTTSMVATFTPCLNFITGSSNNGASPSAGCCASLKSIASTSVDCACLLITANVPLQLPINQTLALSLPRICNIDTVSLQCKPAGAPLPAPGPVLLGPTPPPAFLPPSIPPPTAADSPFSPQASEVVATAPAALSETTDERFTETISPAVDSEGPKRTLNAAIRSVVKSPASGSSLSYVFPSFFTQIIIGAMFFMISY